MKNIWLKTVIKSLFFPDGSIRKIPFGAMKGLVWRVNEITGLSPFYSGAEKDHQKIFQTLVKPGNIVIDVGANWGIHTLYLSTLVKDLGKVISFEPLPEAFTELKWHIEKNNCLNVTPMNIALSNSNGQASFIRGSSSSTSSLSSVSSVSNDNIYTISVETKTLDFVISELNINRLNLIKIDVEGAESLVLKGAEQTIQRFRPYLVVDLHTPEQDISVAQILTKWNYKLSRVSGPPILRTDIGWPSQEGVWGSILASPMN